VADGILLVGDAAGLAFPASGEGILPAVESGILAAEAILAAGGRYDTSKLSSYAAALEHRFGKATPSLLERTAQQLPAPMVRLLAKQLVQNRRFLQGVILEKWFLHRQQAPMALAETLVPQ
jgi:flavin-dependent dehydrogenase